MSATLPSPDALARAAHGVIPTKTAASFFDRSIHWIRWAEKSGMFTDAKGKPIEIPRDDTPNRTRLYTPAICLAIADSLHRTGRIKPLEHESSVRRIRAYQEFLAHSMGAYEKFSSEAANAEVERERQQAEADRDASA